MEKVNEFLGKFKLEIFSILIGYSVLVGFVYNYSLFNFNLEFNIFDYMNTNDIIFSWITDPYIMIFVIVFCSIISLNIFPFYPNLVIVMLLTGIITPLLYKLNLYYIYGGIILSLSIVGLYIKLNYKRYFYRVILLSVLIPSLITYYLKKIELNEIDILFLIFILCYYFVYLSIFTKKYKINIKNKDNLNYSINLINLFQSKSLNQKDCLEFKKKYNLENIINRYNNKLIELRNLSVRTSSLNVNLYSELALLLVSKNDIKDINILMQHNNTMYFKIYEANCIKLLNNLYKLIKLENSFEKEIYHLIIEIEDLLKEIKEIIEINPLFEISIPLLIFLIIPIIAGWISKDMIQSYEKNVIEIKHIKGQNGNNVDNKQYKLFKVTSNYTIVKECNNEDFVVFNNSDISSIKFTKNKTCIEKTKLKKVKDEKLEEINYYDKNIDESMNNIIVTSLNNYLESDNFKIKIGDVIIPQIDSLFKTKFDVIGKFDKLMEFNKYNNGIYFKYKDKLIENEKIYFEPISFNMDSNAKQLLGKLLKDIQNGNKYIINLTGNADLKGINLGNKTIKDNYTLSLARANSVKNHILKVLAEQNIDIQNIQFNINGNSNSEKDERSVEIDILEFIPIIVDKSKLEN